MTRIEVRLDHNGNETYNQAWDNDTARDVQYMYWLPSETKRLPLVRHAP